jgi:hypothetical protein
MLPTNVWKRKTAAHLGRLIPEIINPETGDVVDDRQMEKPFFPPHQAKAWPTSLLPHLRLTRLSRHCASHIEKITGRSDDMIILRGANVFQPRLSEQGLRLPAFFPTIRSELMTEGWMDATRAGRKPSRRGRWRSLRDPGRNHAQDHSQVVGISAQIVWRSRARCGNGPRARRGASWTLAQNREALQNIEARPNCNVPLTQP